MKITCARLPWSITVEPQPGAPFVTVSDVLLAIYTSLRRNVLPTEFASLPSASQYAVNDAFQRRYKRLHAGDREIEKSKGLKRVDFLVDKTTFMGLSATQKGPEVWQLHTS
jgi:hypothetical protein